MDESTTPRGTGRLRRAGRRAATALAAVLMVVLVAPTAFAATGVTVKDTEGLVANTLHSRQLGYQGRVVVYPPQVEPVQRAYSELSADEVERARRVVAAFERAEADGLASIQVDGRFVDYPIYFRARHRLRLSEAPVSESAA